MKQEEKLKLVKRNMEEVVTEEELEEIVSKENPSAYIGFAPTGKMHIGHLLTLRKIADFLKAGFTFKVLIADLHAHLDDKKSPFELLDARNEYTEEAVKGVMEASGVDYNKLEFVKGRDFQLEQDYMLDVLRMAADTTFSRCKRAASEVVRFGDNPKMGGFIYPLMQNQDFIDLDVDVAYGGIDQRGIYMLGREILPERGSDKPTCVFAPLVPGLQGGKMSASDETSKIGVTDGPEAVEEKVMEAYCPQGERKDNGVLAYLKHLIFPILDNEFLIERKGEYGGNLSFSSYSGVEEKFLKGDLHPQDLKKAVAREINKLLQPIRQRFEEKQDLIERAYPES